MRVTGGGSCLYMFAFGTNCSHCQYGQTACRNTEAPLGDVTEEVLDIQATC